MKGKIFRRIGCGKEKKIERKRKVVSIFP